MPAKLPDMNIQLDSTDVLPHGQKFTSFMYSTFLVVSVTMLIYAHFPLSRMWRRTRKGNIFVTKSELKLSCVLVNPIFHFNSSLTFLFIQRMEARIASQ